jgi:glycerate dehydrogenase
MIIKYLEFDTIGEVNGLQEISELGTLTTYPGLQQSDLPDNIKDAEIIIVNKLKINREIIDQCPNLKLICEAATGTNNIDIQYATAKGIVVKNVSGYSTTSVAQHTFALALSLLHQIPLYDRYVKGGEYSQSPIFTNLQAPFFELENKNWGIIGLGNIGKSVAKIAESFGCEVSYFSTSGKNTHQPYTQQSLERLLAESDIVSIHAPLNDRTRNLIGYDELSWMQKHSIIINVGRGGIINEKDLAKAIDDELIFGAGIDVFENEPLDKNSPLLKLERSNNLILTPHTAWISQESRERLVHGVAENIRHFIKHGH